MRCNRRHSADFNPRPPRGGRPLSVSRSPRISIHFNPRPPRGGRLCRSGINSSKMIISIHAPREGGDAMSTIQAAYIVRFQSTPPARGATLYLSCRPPLPQNFNPRPPRGGRQQGGWAAGAAGKISIHAPREGGDGILKHLCFCHVGISIHAPREGGDHGYRYSRWHRWYSNPRPPRGGRLKNAG